ncbi:MAG: VacJ family lipoprotein [Alphaproteobacteria bacterium]|nr:VacJ family lipoprotein [Alphaproteobacteria bacterium]
MAKPPTRLWRFVALALVAAAMAGCASLPEDPIEREIFLETNDPIEPMNRAVFAFNMQLDKYALEPLAKGYRAVFPEFSREMVRNFFHNLKSPVIFINDLLQFEPERAYETAARFLINSTVGIGGLFDIAPFESHDEDLGQTLAIWGAGEGAYIVLPVLGPTNFRDLTGTIGDRLFDPFSYLAETNQVQNAFYGRAAVEGVDNRSRNIDTFDDLERNSFDLYSTFRSLYRQQREFEVRNGAPEPFNGFDFDDPGGGGGLQIMIPGPR